MNKKILSIALALLTLVCVLSLSACGKKAPKGTLTRITVDVNPSIELMVDDQNKVVSATALNDDGSILIAGEALVGMNAEDAAELVVSLAAKTGYIVKGSASADENEVKISVSGNTRYAKNLLSKIEKNISSFMKKNGIKGKVEKVEAAKLEALRKIALSTSLYTEKELAKMEEDQLYRVISAGRIETALLLTEEMREAYYEAKAHKIAFAEREETANVIKALGGMNTLVYTAYKSALDTYSKAITAIDEFRYETFVSPESEYQKSLVKLRESKAELLAQKNRIAKLDKGSAEYAAASASLKIKEDAYESALAAYEKLGEDANAALDKLTKSMISGEALLASVESRFSENIRAELSAKAAEREAAVNAAKASFFENFESAHKDDIKAMQAALEARKQALINSVKEG